MTGTAGAAAVDLLLARLPRLVLVAGKGGVGKTTCAAVLAARAAATADASEARVLLLSTDPARTLGAAIGTPLGAEPAPVAALPALHAMQLDAESARAAFLTKWRSTIVTIVDRGTYLDADDVEGMVEAALPGADEAMALLVLADVVADTRWSRVVVDTAPTGHTLRLLSLPATFRALVALLDTMQEKHRFMVAALTHRYRADAADAFLAEMRERIGALESALRDGQRSAAVIVARPEAVVVAETERLASALRALGIAVGAVVVNAVPAVPGVETTESLARLAGLGDGVIGATVADVGALPTGLQALARWSEAVRVELGGQAAGSRVEPARGEGERSGESVERAACSPTGGGPPAAPTGDRRDEAVPGARERLRAPTDPGAPSRWGGAPRPAHPLDPPSALVRPLTIVGGKGGVGKTTVACALAIAAARDGRVLLVSTDPAPSIADALDLPIGDEEVAVAGVDGLVARQMDAARAFERLRSTYQARIDEVFDGLLGGAMDATHDRRVLRDLLALAPPGIDELYALGSLGETLAEGRFDVVIVDPAPTGHLLRLLEMPALALDWSHRLMRLMLKYKEVAGLGEAAAEVLAFAKRTRAVGGLLRDPARAGLVVAALDEPLVRDETARLAAAVRALGVSLSGVVWNRAAAAVPPLGLERSVPQFVAGEQSPPPRGPAALRRWMDSWRPLTDA